MPSYEEVVSTARSSVIADFARSHAYRERLRLREVEAANNPSSSQLVHGVPSVVLQAADDRVSRKSLKRNMYLEDTSSVTAGRIQQMGLFTMSSVMTMAVVVSLEGMRRGYYAFGVLIPFAAGMGVRSWRLFEEVSEDLRQLQATTEMRTMRKRTINFREVRPSESEDGESNSK